MVRNVLNSSQRFGKLSNVVLYAVMFLLFLFPNTSEATANVMILICICVLLLSLVKYLRVMGQTTFRSFRWLKKGREDVYKTIILLTYNLNNSRLTSALLKKIDLKGKILQGLSSEKIYAFSAKMSFASTSVIIPTRWCQWA